MLSPTAGLPLSSKSSKNFSKTFSRGQGFFEDILELPHGNSWNYPLSSTGTHESVRYNLRELMKLCYGNHFCIIYDTIWVNGLNIILPAILIAWLNKKITFKNSNGDKKNMQTKFKFWSQIWNQREKIQYNQLKPQRALFKKIFKWGGSTLLSR